MRLEWTEHDVEALKKCYSSYPFVLDESIVSKHGKAGCYTKAGRVGLSHRLRSGIPDVASWPETTRAYLAGIIDGEGTITITKNNRKRKNGHEYVFDRPVVTIANTDYKLLDYLKGLGIGGFSHDKRVREPHWKQAFQWSLSAVNAVYAVLEVIHPYLVIKKDKAEYVMSWIRDKYGAESFRCLNS